jgi:hypothetical protein
MLKILLCQRAEATKYFGFAETIAPTALQQLPQALPSVSYALPFCLFSTNSGGIFVKNAEIRLCAAPI